VLNNSYFTFIVGYPSGLLSPSGYPFNSNFKHPEALSGLKGALHYFKIVLFLNYSTLSIWLD